MNGREKISDTQFTYLFFAIVVATIVLFVPQILTDLAGRSAWIVPLVIPPMAGFLSFEIAQRLSKRFPGLSLPQYAEMLMGKAAGKGLGIIYVLFLLWTYDIIIREYTDFIKITMLFNTPRLALILTAVALGSYAAVKGLESIARAAQFVLPLFLGFSLFILLLTIPDMDPGNLLPFLEGGVAPILRGSFVPAFWYGEIGLLILFLPVANDPKQLRSKAAIGLGILSLFVALETAATIMVFGSPLTQSRLFPFWSLSTYIQFQNYVHRVESFLVIVWLGQIYIKIALFSYMVLKATVQIFDFKSLKRVQISLAAIEVLAAWLFLANIAAVQKVTINYLTPAGLFFEIGVPAFLLILASVRKKGKTG